MKLATLRLEGAATTAVRIDGDAAIEISGYADLGALLAVEGWRDIAAVADGTSHVLSEIAPQSWAPVVPKPGKIICVGQNYETHIKEMGRELPQYPTLFAKFPEALVGAFDEIEMPAVSSQVDWEAELAVVIGAPARRVSESDAKNYIAGYAVINDVSMRDYQYRTLQWLQGKTFENTAPFGPYLVTADEWDLGPIMKCVVDGETVQETTTAELVFTPAKLVSYISDIITLNAGDVIATGTTGGVGHARTPARYLSDGSLLETSIEGLGAQRNIAKVV
ncbi:fumarylacetoacetate hydrolase family protein [Salinibacterium hongtaonis]|uniref:Fumarylacetoacetase-like C-terminal domain-containing protein n=1 Tax=Homoserinimonas hongtaonis TaxID=2079791 RepID=A0A2U1T2M7_9MICO|nr:fumarylacetoacetate hydrolase family protein [Salinibacterium hongtaonis]PWB98100.1 hypothetical protein DF220_09875 [Salinibacterium hongtaonis]